MAFFMPGLPEARTASMIAESRSGPDLAWTSVAISEAVFSTIKILGRDRGRSWLVVLADEESRSGDPEAWQGARRGFGARRVDGG
jgi:hypothetical protein